MGALLPRRLRVLVICEELDLMLHVYNGLPVREYELFATPYYMESSRQAYELRPDAVLIAAQNASRQDWLDSVRSLRSLSAVPIVALLHDGDTPERPVAHGATTCIKPPFDARRIDDTLRGVTSGSKLA